MMPLNGKGNWYGKLKIGTKSVPVIYDHRLLPGIKGCIYLYNAERDAIVQYVWDIVKDRLASVENDERKSMKAALDARWRQRRREFTRGRPLPSGSSRKQAPIATRTDDIWSDTEEDANFELEDIG